MTALYVSIGSALGLLLGFVFGWTRRKPTESTLEPELRRQVQEKESQLVDARLRENALIAEKSAALAEREATKALLDAQKSSQEKAQADLREAFQALSADALAQNQTRFLSLAQESFAKVQESAKGDLAQRQEAIAGLLKPLNEQLRMYQERLQQGATAQATVLGEVKQRLEVLTKSSESLAKETEQFRMVLNSNQARGRWGEETLRRVVEAAGMSEHCDFEEQAQSEDKKPDMVIRLPGDRRIILDAKVPDLDFLTALETSDPVKRAQSLSEHARKLKDTIRGLADRNYPAQFPNSLDYVVLFLPAESLFSAALEGDRDLIVWAANKKIMLATPASLIGLLRAVSLSWDQFRQTENIRAIAEAAQELYSRVATFVGHFSGIRDHLTKANEAFNKAVGSYDRMVRPQGEKLVKLGTSSGLKDLSEITMVENTLRLPLGGS